MLNINWKFCLIKFQKSKYIDVYIYLIFHDIFIIMRIEKNGESPQLATKKVVRQGLIDLAKEKEFFDEVLEQLRQIPSGSAELEALRKRVPIYIRQIHTFNEEPENKANKIEFLKTHKAIAGLIKSVPNNTEIGKIFNRLFATFALIPGSEAIIKNIPSTDDIPAIRVKSKKVANPDENLLRILAAPTSVTLTRQTPKPTMETSDSSFVGTAL